MYLINLIMFSCHKLYSHFVTDRAEVFTDRSTSGLQISASTIWAHTSESPLFSSTSCGWIRWSSKQGVAIDCKKASFFANSQYLSTPLQQRSSHRNSKQRCFLTNCTLVNVVKNQLWCQLLDNPPLLPLRASEVHLIFQWRGLCKANFFYNFPHGFETLLFHNHFVVHVDRWEQSRAFYARTDNLVSAYVCSRILLNCTSSASLFQRRPAMVPV